MVILPATEADLQAVIELVAQGRAALARQGVDQWQDGYPSPETIRRDLLRGDGRIVRIDGAAAAYAAFVFDGEPAYDRIEEGGWAAEGPYVAVHRLVVGERFVRRGIAAALLREAAREALVRGIRSFRIDTHPDNGPMRALLVREVRLSGQGALRSRAAGLREADLRLIRSGTLPPPVTDAGIFVRMI